MHKQVTHFGKRRPQAINDPPPPPMPIIIFTAQLLQLKFVIQVKIQTVGNDIYGWTEKYQDHKILKLEFGEKNAKKEK